MPHDVLVKFVHMPPRFPLRRQSPLALGQEQYPDPWQHIVFCVLCRWECLSVEEC